ncbi:MAG: ABC transporter substrate-binding protein [Turicibacter sp.]
MKLIKYLIIAVFSLSFTACSQPVTQTEPVETSNEPYTFTDALNQEVTVTKQIENVVSLYGSYAQVWELGGGTLVGVTDDALERDVLTSQDASIVGSTKTPNIELILALNPDLVLLNPNISEQLEIAQVLKQSQIPTAFFDVEVFEDYLSMLNIVTDITERKDLYEENGEAVHQKITDILANTGAKNDTKILLLRAFSSGVKARDINNMTGQMLQSFGTVNLTELYPSLLEDLSTEIIIKEDPDYIFVTTMGNDTDKAISVLEESILTHPAYQNLKAIKNNNVHILPKDLFHYKPNQRWDQAYEYLSDILN